MQYRQLGNSGLRVSTFTLGTMGFGGTGWAGPVGQISVEGAREQISIARDAGVNLIDTADGYSNGLSEEILGEAEVRALFKASKIGTIAGCMVTTGVVRRNARVRLVRDGTVIHESSIAQLKRFKEDAREVAEGFECGILLDGFNDVKEGDVLEIFETREVERTDLDTPAS